MICYYPLDDKIFFFLGEVIKHDEMKCIMGEGMPQYKNPFEKGKLIIMFQVKFPEENWIPPVKLVELEKLLPPRQELIIPDHAEECDLQKIDPNAEQTRRRVEAYDSDDESQMHGQRVQCATH